MKPLYKASVVKIVCGGQERDTGQWDLETYMEGLQSHIHMETCPKWHCKSICKGWTSQLINHLTGGKIDPHLQPNTHIIPGWINDLSVENV